MAILSFIWSKIGRICIICENYHLYFGSDLPPQPSPQARWRNTWTIPYVFLNVILTQVKQKLISCLVDFETWEIGQENENRTYQ